MFFPPMPSSCYALPPGPRTAMAERAFAAGDEPWTRRAVARVDEQAFAPGEGATARLRLTCQRLERAFLKACDGTATLAPGQGGLTDDERRDWASYGATYLGVREAAFRVLWLRAISPGPALPASGRAHLDAVIAPADPGPARRACDNPARPTLSVGQVA